MTTNVNRSATHHSLCSDALRWSQLFVAVVATIVCGCAGPWAGTSNIPLPAAGSTPSALDVAVPKHRTLPHVEQAARQAQQQQLLQQTQVERADEGADTQDLEDIDVVVRGQSVEPAPTGGQRSATDSGVQLAQYEQAPASGGQTYGGYDPGYGGQNFAPPYSSQSYGSQSYAADPSGQSPVYSPGEFAPGQSLQGGYGPSQTNYDGSGIDSPLPPEYADLVVNLRETQTGRFMFGVGVNSDLGLTAQAIIDERNFDWKRWPRNLDEVINGTAWRGGGQTLRIEAVPGTEVQRYLVNFTQPYLFDTPISFNVSGYLYDRRYFDWDEQRLGGRIGFGYRITPDLSLGLSLRGEQVDFKNPRIRGIRQIEDVLGESDIFSGKVTLTHDTRDIPFAATQGHYLELSYEQVFGTFDYPRGNIDYRRYFLLKQRADGSGRHTMSFSFKGGITGSQTPVFENFFAGGYSTLRGFRFRHASPKVAGDVIVGGQLSLLGSAEYIFPITADDMLKGAVFCDYGTVEEVYDDIEMDDFRVAVGAGLRISVPAMGPAPIAVDFAVPINREGTDRIQNFSFFMGMMR